MANENVLRRREFILGGTALAGSTVLGTGEAEAAARVSELKWGRLKRFSQTALFVDARVENVEGRKSPLPPGVKQNRVIQAEYDDEVGMFLRPEQESALRGKLMENAVVITLCEKGRRSMGLANEIANISKGPGMKVKMIYSLEDGLSGITDEERLAEVKIDQKTERR